VRESARQAFFSILVEVWTFECTTHGHTGESSPMSRFVKLAAVLAASVLYAAASDKVIKRVPVNPTSPVSGQGMFNEYCVSCHGKDAKGTGPAASALKKTPADLTTLAVRNNGKFPELRVYSTILGDVDVAAHGSRDMPVWGSVFQDMSRSNGEVQMRISNLVSFVKTLQTK
jgi:mono/diheme cytochrome c family protein